MNEAHRVAYLDRTRLLWDSRRHVQAMFPVGDIDVVRFKQGLASVRQKEIIEIADHEAVKKEAR